MTDRFIIDDAGTLIDMETRNTYDYVTEICPILNQYDAENKMIKNTIKEMYENERTYIGKSTLKQLMEQIE